MNISEVVLPLLFRILVVVFWTLDSVVSAGLVSPSHLPARSGPDRDGAWRMIYADLAIIIHTKIINGGH